MSSLKQNNARLISPKRCGSGSGPGFCNECHKHKRSHERARKDKDWICEDCRIEKGTYYRHCDGCSINKKAKHQCIDYGIGGVKIVPLNFWLNI